MFVLFQTKIQELEDQVRAEKLHRKTLQNRTEQVSGMFLEIE